MGGDFNVVRYPGEHWGTIRLSNQMQQFNRFIQECELIDLPLRGASYTWTNNQDRRVCSRLDQFLLSSDWLNQDQWWAQ